MRLTTNLVVCTFCVQFTIGCSASLSEQCRQINAIIATHHISDTKEPSRRKESERLARDFKQGSQDISQLSISDSSLKVIQQRIIKIYNDLAENAVTQSDFEKQKELFNTSSSVSVEEMKKQLAVIDQSTENLKQRMVLTKMMGDTDNELTAICSAR